MWGSVMGLHLWPVACCSRRIVLFYVAVCLVFVVPVRSHQRVRIDVLYMP